MLGLVQPFETAATIFERTEGSSQRRKLWAIDKPLSAIKPAASTMQAANDCSCADKENSRPIRVVTVASRTE